MNVRFDMACCHVVRADDQGGAAEFLQLRRSPGESLPGAWSIVRGKIEGKVTGRDRVQLWSTGQVTGEVQTDRLSIEDGALLRGKVEAGRQPNKLSEIKASAATATGKTADSTSLNSGTAAD